MLLHDKESGDILACLTTQKAACPGCHALGDYIEHPFSFNRLLGAESLASELRNKHTKNERSERKLPRGEQIYAASLC